MDRPRNRRSLQQRDQPLPRVGGTLADEASRVNPLNRKPNQQRRGPQKQRRKLLLKSMVVIVVFLVCRQMVLPIQTVSFGEGAPSGVQAALDSYFTTHSRRNVFIRASSLETGLLHSLDRATAVHAQHNLLASSLHVIVDSDEPAVRWQSQGVQYTVSTHGIALQVTTDVDNNKLPLVFDSSGVPFELKNQVAPASFIAFVQELETAAAELKLNIQERTVEVSTRELLIQVRGRSYYLRLSTQARAGEQLQAFLKLEEHLKKQNIKPRQYADLRIANRAYWK